MCQHARRLVSSLRTPWAGAISAVALDPVCELVACVCADGAISLFRFAALLVSAGGSGLLLHTLGAAAGQSLNASRESASAVNKYMRREADWERAPRQVQVCQRFSKSDAGQVGRRVKAGDGQMGGDTAS